MLFKELTNSIELLKNVQISAERKEVLQPIIDFVQLKTSEGKQINLNFICTHNSRRSHLSQVWAQAAAHYFNIKNVYCYSGGTEATALFYMSAKALEHAGFQIETLAEGTNPVYAIKYDKNVHPIIGFSKTYDDAFNPQSDFAAIMTCNNADVGCPFIPGASKRIAVKYDDPKAFDNTPQQAEKYIERSHQIASEMLFVFSQIQ
jgi:arsenate reductase